MNTSTKKYFNDIHQDLTDLLQARKRFLHRIVHTGIQYLDMVIPNWRKLVNEHDLDMEQPNKCVLGQIFGDYHRGLTALGLSDSDAVALGFVIPNDELYTSDQLAAVWRGAMNPAYSQGDTWWSLVA